MERAPKIGRFISQDSYRGEDTDYGTWHLYSYCASNSISYTDPSGHIRIKIKKPKFPKIWKTKYKFSLVKLFIKKDNRNISKFYVKVNVIGTKKVDKISMMVAITESKGRVKNVPYVFSDVYPGKFQNESFYLPNWKSVKVHSIYLFSQTAIPILLQKTVKLTR